MSYPATNYPLQAEAALSWRDPAEVGAYVVFSLEQYAYVKVIMMERDDALAEAAKWRNAHASLLGTKRSLSAKYGAIMARKPGARYRRTKKRIKRSVTKVTDKLRRPR